jgi:hypothetical protein
LFDILREREKLLKTRFREISIIERFIDEELSNCEKELSETFLHIAKSAFLFLLRREKGILSKDIITLALETWNLYNEKRLKWLLNMDHLHSILKKL